MDHLQPYVPIAMILLLAGAFSLVTLVAGRMVGPRRLNPNKLLPYESGMIPTGEANVRIPIKFYMVALLFLLFDIETIFVISWAVIFNSAEPLFDSEQFAFSRQAFQRFASVEMLTFIAILMVGYLYVWRKGGFQWS